MPHYNSHADFYVIPTSGPKVGTKISSLPYSIRQPGFYYLAGSLFSSGSGILVGTSDVTIDLMGFSITGSGLGTSYGVVMNSQRNVEIRNGTIVNFTEGILEENGIYSFMGTCVIDQNTAVGNNEALGSWKDINVGSSTLGTNFYQTISTLTSKE